MNGTAWAGAALILLVCAFGIIQWIRGWNARDREDPLKAVRRRHPAWFDAGDVPYPDER